MSLNALYGVGTRATLANNLDLGLPGVTGTITGEWDDGPRVGVSTAWSQGGTPAATMLVICSAKTIHFANLVIEPTFRGQGAYRALCNKLPGFFRARGVTEFTASPDAFGTHSEWLLRQGGFVADTKRGLLVHTIEAGCRMDQIKDWKAGTAPEPQWHIDLVAKPPDAAADTTSPVG